MTYISNKDPFVQHAIAVIKDTYGDDVSMEAKNKDLLKFGRNPLCQTSKSTIMTLPTGIFNEVYLSSNLITTVSSDSVSDTQLIKVEGHTIAAGVFTFIIQNVTLNGQTQVSLTTPLARISRMVNIGSIDLVGTIYGYETDTTTSGIPDTSSKVHIMIAAGLNNTEKAATTISDTDYWLITSIYADCLEKVATYGILHLEIREAGGVFINKIDRSVGDTYGTEHTFKPYLIVPKNADVRLRVSASANNKDFSGGIEGVLLKVI